MAIVEYLNYEVVDDQGWDVYDEENFERAAGMDLPEEEHGFVDVAEGQYILEAAESEGKRWPFSCRNGICSNCAAIVVEGDVDMDGNQALSAAEVEEKAVRLTCIGTPATDYVRIVYNAKHLDYLQNRVI
ncbi:MAG: ferredoxin Fer [Halobacteriaceae archaeon]